MMGNSRDRKGLQMNHLDVCSSQRLEFPHSHCLFIRYLSTKMKYSVLKLLHPQDTGCILSVFGVG